MNYPLLNIFFDMLLHPLLTVSYVYISIIATIAAFYLLCFCDIDISFKEIRSSLEKQLFMVKGKGAKIIDALFFRILNVLLGEEENNAKI